MSKGAEVDASNNGSAQIEQQEFCVGGLGGTL
jgi:hypothetical protein